MQELKIGIIGLGSIGLRHLNELLGLGVTNIYALRTNKGAKELPPEVVNQVISTTSKEEFFNWDLDGYLVTNPTSLHVEILKELKQFNKPIFVEKPLCNNPEELQTLGAFNGELLQVGFCLRFLNVIREVKKILDTKEYGAVYHSRLNVGQYLPSWHPYTDYKTEYYARKELGGGVLRTLSHELDLAFFFFGKPASTKTLISKTSDLEIDVDDYALVLMQFEKHLCRIELDFMSKKKERTGTVFCEQADIHYDVFSRSVEVTDKEGTLILKPSIEENNMYRDQMEAFLEFIKTKNRNPQAANFEESIALMKIIADEKLI